MPPEYEEDESELEAALAAPKALAPVRDAGTEEYADDAELDAALAKPTDISDAVRASLPTEGQVSSEDFDAAARGSKVTELPVQHIEGTVPKKPWYSRFVPNGTALAHGLGAGATMNWGEEGAAGILSLLPTDTSKDGGIPREYAAGSQYADTHNVLEKENQKLREEHPVAFGAGEMLGAAPAAVAAGGGAAPSLGRLLGTAGVQGAIAGSGYDTENRARGAAVGGATGAATAGVLHGAGTGLQKTAQNAVNESNRLITQTFMTPAQRAAYQKAHGLDSLRELGSDARDAGLFKTLALPPRAGTVAKRANEVMEKSGGAITGFEDDLVKQGINPDVQVKPIVDDLRGAADEVSKMPALGAGEMSGTLKEQADLLAQPKQTSTPVADPHADARLLGGAAGELPPPPEPTVSTTERSALPFSEATALKRFLGKQINWDKNPRARQLAQGTEEARKLTWKGTAQQIDKALAGDPRVDPAKLAGYNQDKKNFSTAATAFDPAVSMMEREGEMGLGARDLMAATAFGGGNPALGGLASMANKTGAGMVPALGSAALRRYAGATGGLGVLSPNKQVGPVRDFARKNIGLAPLLRHGARVAGVEKADNAVDLVRELGPEKANEETKKQLNELLPGGPK